MNGFSLLVHVVSPRTAALYSAAARQFLSWCFANRSVHRGELDFLLASYIQSLFDSGGTFTAASRAVCAVQHFVPSARRRLDLSWRLLKGWRKIAPINRAPPLPEDMLLGVVGLLLLRGDPRTAAQLAVGFYLFPRPAELGAMRA